MITESSESNVINSRLSPSSMQEEEERMSSESGSSLDHDINRNIEKQPMPKSSVITADAASISSSSLPPDIKTIQKTPSDKYMSDDIVGDEDRCKRKFAKMVLAANKFQTQQEKDERPSHMALLFDVHGNIDMMRMVRQGKSEYHKFCG
ncbi:MAG: hypothetical protein JSY10_25050 [Paenibacillus sp.]|nr:hypothetical protein [Paenibacillus sp.]